MRWRRSAVHAYHKRARPPIRFLCEAHACVGLALRPNCASTDGGTAHSIDQPLLIPISQSSSVTNKVAVGGFSVSISRMRALSRISGIVPSIAPSSLLINFHSSAAYSSDLMLRWNSVVSWSPAPMTRTVSFSEVAVADMNVENLSSCVSQLLSRFVHLRETFKSVPLIQNVRIAKP
jgi:hypothetical protein